jgi:quercetin dioxygenase-like cupin family protein
MNSLACWGKANDLVETKTSDVRRTEMKRHLLKFGRFVSFALSMASIALTGLLLSPSPATAQGQYVVTPVAEMKVKQLPKGPLYWRIENFPTLEQAKAAASSYRWNADTVSFDGSPSLTAEVAGKIWLFTLGPKGGATPGGTQVAEIGPVPPISAPEYLLRINRGFGPPGANTPVHSHPGSEAFYVVAGRLGQRTPHGVNNVEAGHTMNGHPADTVMEVFNSGTTDLTALIMFVVDATKPFSSPAKFE